MLKKNEEKRGHTRYSVNGIYGNVHCTSDLNVINISAHGATIETLKRLELNKEYTFRIYFKEALLRIKGHVVWSLLTQKKESEDLSPVYRTGVKFINGKNEQVNIQPDHESIILNALNYAYAN